MWSAPKKFELIYIFNDLIFNMYNRIQVFMSFCIKERAFGFILIEFYLIQVFLLFVPKLYCGQGVVHVLFYCKMRVVFQVCFLEPSLGLI